MIISHYNKSVCILGKINSYAVLLLKIVFQENASGAAFQKPSKMKTKFNLLINLWVIRYFIIACTVHEYWQVFVVVVWVGWLDDELPTTEKDFLLYRIEGSGAPVNADSNNLQDLNCKGACFSMKIILILQ